MNFTEANINSLPTLSGAPDMSIAGYIAAYELISTAGFILIAVFAASLSLILENGVKALTTVAVVVVLPVLIGYAGADLLKPFSFAEVLAPSIIRGSIPAYIICAAIALLMLTAGYYKWNGQREGKLKRN